MLETRHSKIDFLGKDGFQWFIAQVAPDKVWRTESNQNFNNGFRAKIRILGYHPADNGEEGGISDEDLPWAHFLVAPQFGAGNNNTGTSFALQGGEMVVGFFLDGEEAQQPVILGAFFANYAIEDPLAFKDAIKQGTSGFQAVAVNTDIENGNHISLKNQEQTLDSGVIINSNQEIRNQNNELKTTIEHYYDNKSYDIVAPDKCEDSQQKSGGIAKGLQKFFEKVNKLEKFSDGYIDPVLNKIVDIDEEIDKATDEISQAMSGIIRGARFKLFEDINKKVDDAIDFLSPDYLIKSLEVKKAKDGVFCAIENILNGLKNMVGNFLKGLLGNLLNIPLCAAEQFMAGLMSMLNFRIGSLLAPLLGGLSALTGMAMPSFQGIMSKAMGISAAALSLFECEGQKCSLVPDFLTDSGPDPKKTLGLEGVLDKFTTLSGSGLVGGLTGLVGLSFPNVSGISDEIGGLSGSSPLEGLVGGCNVTDKTCYPPRIEIFGGGGLGAAADAVVNEIGQVIGVRMTDFGIGYTEAPYVSVIDDCDNGRGASGRAIMNGDQVVNIVFDNVGSGYLAPDSVADASGVDVIGYIDGAEIVTTGAGYEEGDLIVSESGQTMIPKIEDGRIVGVSGTLDQGLSTIPKLGVRTNTGVGAILRPITRFVKREEYTDPIVPQSRIITVISCPRFY